MRIDEAKILVGEEIQEVIKSLRSHGRRWSRTRAQNLALFRLSCCCGLRVKEIVGLDVCDVITEGRRPVIQVSKEITKGRMDRRRSRRVPLWWDSGTLGDLAEWKDFRMQEAGPEFPFICAYDGSRMSTRNAQNRWRTAIRQLGDARSRQLSIHCGRHSFISHSLYAGRSLAEVRDAAGHSNVSTTSIYLHVINRADVPDVFS